MPVRAALHSQDGSQKSKQQRRGRRAPQPDVAARRPSRHGAWRRETPAGSARAWPDGWAATLHSSCAVSGSDQGDGEQQRVHRRPHRGPEVSGPWASATSEQHGCSANFKEWRAPGDSGGEAEQPPQPSSADAAGKSELFQGGRAALLQRGGLARRGREDQHGQQRVGSEAPGRQPDHQNAAEAHGAEFRGAETSEQWLPAGGGRAGHRSRQEPGRALQVRGLRAVPLPGMQPTTGPSFLLDVRPSVRVLGAERGGVHHLRLLRQGAVLPLLQRRRGHVRRQALLLRTAALLRPLDHRLASLAALPLSPVLPPS